MAALQSRAWTTDGLGVAHRVGGRLACRRLAGEPDPERCRAGVPVTGRAFSAVCRTSVGAAAFPEDHTAVSLRQVGEARSPPGHQANALAASHRAEANASVGHL